jgi:hypothetical protein
MTLSIKMLSIVTLIINVHSLVGTLFKLFGSGSQLDITTTLKNYLLIMAILIALNMGVITYNDITYN